MKFSEDPNQSKMNLPLALLDETSGEDISISIQQQGFAISISCRRPPTLPLSAIVSATEMTEQVDVADHDCTFEYVRHCFVGCSLTILFKVAAIIVPDGGHGVSVTKAASVYSLGYSVPGEINKKGKDFLFYKAYAVMAVCYPTLFALDDKVEHYKAELGARTQDDCNDTMNLRIPAIPPNVIHGSSQFLEAVGQGTLLGYVHDAIDSTRHALKKECQFVDIEIRFANGHKLAGVNTEDGYFLGGDSTRFVKPRIFSAGPVSYVYWVVVQTDTTPRNIRRTADQSECAAAWEESLKKMAKTCEGLTGLETFFEMVKGSLPTVLSIPCPCPRLDGSMGRGGADADNENPAKKQRLEKQH